MKEKCNFQSYVFTAYSYETDCDVQYKRPQLVSFLRPSILCSILVLSTVCSFYEYVTLLYTEPSTGIEKKILGGKKRGKKRKKTH